MAEDVYLFWDNSNIFIPAKFVAARREGTFGERDVRIQFDNLYRLAHADRTVRSAVCVGSVPPELDAVWKRLTDVGVDVELFERGSESGTEQGVDQCLQVHMLRAALDAPTPGIAVLLTGDGAGYDTGAGFHADLERMHSKGWGIEVLSWDAACKRTLKEWASKVGIYVKLDDHYDAVTFLEKGRRSKSLDLRRRARAQPRVQ